MDTRSWLVEELQRMDDARVQLSWLLEEFQQAADLPLLARTLEEQRAVNVGLAERLQRMYAALGVVGTPSESAAARGLIGEARAMVRAVAPEVRDAAIAAHATRIEHWEVGAWRTLSRLFRLAVLDPVADEIEELLSELREAERHLESLAPSLGDEEGPSELHGAAHRLRGIGLGRGPIS